MLISELLESATDTLTAAGVTSPSVDAELLGCYVLEVDRADLTLLAITNQSFPENKIPEFLEAVQRRKAREPLQHITGKAPFRHLELEVGPGVFIPRPETEQVVDLALQKLAGIENPVVVDLCSGSGAIAIALSTEVQGSKVFAVEISSEAFGYLIRNFEKYGLSTTVTRNQDIAQALEELKSSVDLVVTNPPYIPNSAIPIDLEVQLYDPKIALYGGQDGLDVVRTISKRGMFLLKPGGQLVLEHAHTQAAQISELLLSEGWEEVVSSKDLSGKDRMISARRP